MTKPQNTEEKIYTALANVMQDIEAIGKDRKNVQQNFMFRGIDQAYNALHPLMAKYQIITVPRVLEMISRDERRTKSGGIISFTLLKVEYDFICGLDGSRITVGPIIGEGMDSGDKGCNKALAIAHKYALFQLFMIPTEKVDDPDAESHQVVDADNDWDDAVVEPKTKVTPIRKDDDTLVIDTDDGAKFIADQLIQLASMHSTVASLKDFWRKNQRPLKKLEAEYVDHYQRVLEYFTQKANEYKETENV